MGLLDRLLLGFSLSEPIPRHLLGNLKKYRYNSQDNSLLSKYVLCHYWNALIKLFPLTVAPNMITLLGLLTIVVSAGLSVYFAPDLNTMLPSWLYLYIGASVWTYASFDAIDGKQARRTGQCGPLGELFDHGCDALNLSLMNLILPLIFGLKIDWLFMMATFMLLFVFYIVTWDEYHTHMLYLTVISGPVEGTIIFTVASILSGQYGIQLWQKPIHDFVPIVANTPLASLSINALIPMGLISAGVLTIITSLRRVTLRWKRAPLQLIPFTSFLVSVAVCLHAEPVLWTRIVQVLLYLGFTFSHAVASLILGHLTLSEPSFYEPSYLPAVLGSLMITAKLLNLVTFSSDQVLSGLRIAVIYAVATYFIRAFLTIRQIASHMGIYCLSIKKKLSKSD